MPGSSGAARVPTWSLRRRVIQVDLRSVQRATLEEAEAAVRQIAASTTVADTTCEVSIMGRFWPMEKLERSGRLVDHAVAVAATWASTCGTRPPAALRTRTPPPAWACPSIDGLGPIGGNDHSPAEYLEVDSIVPRTVLLAGLILALGRDPVVAQWSAERRARS